VSPGESSEIRIRLLEGYFTLYIYVWHWCIPVSTVLVIKVWSFRSELRVIKYYIAIFNLLQGHSRKLV